MDLRKVPKECRPIVRIIKIFIGQFEYLEERPWWINFTGSIWSVADPRTQRPLPKAFSWNDKNPNYQRFISNYVLRENLLSRLMILYHDYLFASVGVSDKESQIFLADQPFAEMFAKLVEVPEDKGLQLVLKDRAIELRGE